jgi:hypothetical protein
MAEASAFEFVCAEIEQATSLNALEARGTVRLALKSAGVDARSVSSSQLKVILKKRGCEDADNLCKQIATRMAGRSFESAGPESPEAVFARLGGS